MAQNDERSGPRGGNVQEKRMEKRPGENVQRDRSAGGGGLTGKESMRPQSTRPLVEPDRDDPATAPRGGGNTQEGKAQAQRKSGDRYGDEIEDGEQSGQPKDGSKASSSGGEMGAGKGGPSADGNAGATRNSKR